MGQFFQMCGGIINLAALVIGLILCFRGYRFFRLSISFLAAILGNMLADYFIGLFESFAGTKIDAIVTLIVHIVFAVGFFIMGYKLWKKAVFFVSAALVALSSLRLASGHTFKPDSFFNNRIILLISCIAVGIVAGFLVCAVEKWAIVILTAIYGAYLASSAIASIGFFFDRVSQAATELANKIFASGNISAQSAVTGILLLILSVAGFCVQAKHSD